MLRQLSISKDFFDYTFGQRHAPNVGEPLPIDHDHSRSRIFPMRRMLRFPYCRGLQECVTLCGFRGVQG